MCPHEPVPETNGSGADAEMTPVDLSSAVKTNEGPKHGEKKGFYSRPSDFLSNTSNWKVSESLCLFGGLVGWRFGGPTTIGVGHRHEFGCESPDLAKYSEVVVCASECSCRSPTMASACCYVVSSTQWSLQREQFSRSQWLQSGRGP